MRRSVPEAVGLSVLDLVCGLFGLIVLLFAISERNDGSPGVASKPLKFVRVEAENHAQIVLGLELKINGNDYHSWPDCSDVGPIRWGSCEPGLLEALIEGEGDANDFRVLAIRREDGRPLPVEPIKVLLSTEKYHAICTLKHDNFYRIKTQQCQT